MPDVPSWSPPYGSEFKLRDCPATGQFVADFLIATDMWDMSIDVVLRFLNSLGQMDSMGNAPQNWTLLEWWETRPYQHPYDLAWNATREFESQCHLDYCKFIPIEGDPDLAGVGMMTSYYLVATLATLYVIILSLNSIKALRQYDQWKKLHKLFEHTTISFLDASLLFSISMLLAAIYRFISASEHPDRKDNTFFYSLVNASTIPTFSVFPPLMLHFPARKERRQTMRAILWSLVIGLVITLTVLNFSYWTDYAHIIDEWTNNPDQALWLAWCDLNSGSILDAADYSNYIALAVLGLNLPRWISLLCSVNKQRQGPNRSFASQGHADNYLRRTWSMVKQFYGKYGKYVRALNIALCCATMWLLLGIFTVIVAHNAEAMGWESKERQLSVGQVLAVATFVPLIIDIAAIVMEKEPGQGLAGKLPRNMTIQVEKPPSVEDRALTLTTYSSGYNVGASPDYERLSDGGGRRWPCD